MHLRVLPKTWFSGKLMVLFPKRSGHPLIGVSQDVPSARDPKMLHHLKRSHCFQEHGDEPTRLIRRQEKTTSQAHQHIHHEEDACYEPDDALPEEAMR
jgi:hypothetical protein